MTKDEINAQYSMNCTTIGDIYGQMEKHKKLIGEMQAKIDKLIVKNFNLGVDMENLLNEEAKAAAKPTEPHAIVGTA